MIASYPLCPILSLDRTYAPILSNPRAFDRCWVLHLPCYKSLGFHESSTEIPKVCVARVALLGIVSSEETMRGAHMQHYAELETTKLGKEVQDWCPEDEEDVTCDLQCADSLAIAVNRTGEDAFGLKHLLRSLKALRWGKHRPKLYSRPFAH
jgi:hypothetical protein